MRDPKRLVIVGGGITGLAAAHAARAHASELGREIDVTVLEGSERFGGNIVTTCQDGFLLDGGPDSWVANKPHASTLARELGLGGALVDTIEANRRYYVAWNGSLYLVPEGLVLGVPTKLAPLLTTRLFSWRAKVRMALEPLVPSVRDLRKDESVAEFARRRLGREVSERLVAPLLSGISAGDASDLSVRAAFPQLVAMEREYGSLVQGMRAQRRALEGRSGRPSRASAFVSLGGGTGVLVEALVERLRAGGTDLRTGAAVNALWRKSASWSLSVDGGGRFDADAVLLAIPARAAAPLAATHDQAVARMLENLRSTSTATVFLGYRRVDVAHPLDASGFIVPRAEGRPILAATWVSSKWAGRAPDGHVLLRVFVGGPGGEELLRDDDAQLIRVARGELSALMDVAADPVLSKVFRFDRGSAQMRVGHVDAIRALRERLAVVAPGVRIAGGGYEGIGIPDCIRQGQEAARALVNAL